MHDYHKNGIVTSPAPEPSAPPTPRTRPVRLKTILERVVAQVRSEPVEHLGGGVFLAERAVMVAAVISIAVCALAAISSSFLSVVILPLRYEDPGILAAFWHLFLVALAWLWAIGVEEGLSKEQPEEYAWWRWETRIGRIWTGERAFHTAMPGRPVKALLLELAVRLVEWTVVATAAWSAFVVLVVAYRLVRMALVGG